MSVEDFLDMVTEDARPLASARRRTERRPLPAYDHPDVSEDRMARIVSDAMEKIQGTMRANEARTAAALEALNRRMTSGTQDNRRESRSQARPQRQDYGIRQIFDELERRLVDSDEDGYADLDQHDTVADLLSRRERGGRLSSASARSPDELAAEGREESRRFRQTLEAVSRSAQDAPLKTAQGSGSALQTEMLAALKTIERKLSNLEKTAPSDGRHLTDLTSEMSALRRAMASQKNADASGVERQIASLASRIDAMAKRMSQPQAKDDKAPEVMQAVKELEAKLDMITRSAAEPIQRVTSALARLSQREMNPAGVPELIEMVRALDRKVDRAAGSADGEALAALREDITSLKQVLTRTDAPPHLDAKLDALSERVETLTEKLLAIRLSAGPRDLRQKPLDAEFEEVKHLIRASMTPCDDTRVLEAIEGLTQRINTLEQTPNHLVERLERIHQLMNERPTGPLPPNMEVLLRELAQRLESGQGVPVDEHAFQKLQNDIREIANKLDKPANARDMIPIERAVHDLVQGLDGIRLGVEATAAKAARQAATQAIQDINERSVSPDVLALRQSLDAMMAMQQDSGIRTTQTLEAVHDTLQKVVDRLIGMEREAQARPVVAPMMGYGFPPGVQQSPMAMGGMPSSPTPPPMAYDAAMPAAAPQGPETLARTAEAEASIQALTDLARQDRSAEATAPKSGIAAALAAARTAVSSATGRLDPRASKPKDSDPILLPNAQEPSLNPRRDSTFDIDLPLEPGSGRAQPTESGVPVAASEFKPTGDAKADFIAAARRAAQAAAAQSEDALRAAKGQGKSKAANFLATSGKFSMPGNLTTKHAILLGLAATVVAVGAASQFVGGASKPAAVVVEPPARNGSNTTAQRQQTAAVAPAQRPVTPARDVTAQPLPNAVTSPQPAAEQRSVSRAASNVGPDEPITVGAINPRTPAAQPQADTAPRAMISADDPLLKFEGMRDLEPLKQAARRGETAALIEVGARYLDGRGATRDPRLAAQWFQKAAEAGSAAAQYRLGALYREGRGVNRDPKQALRLFQQSAEGGNIRGMHNTAVLLAEGVNGAPDYNAASEWFKKAAEHGIRDSQYNLAILYARGLGVPQDLLASYMWFSAAATQGDEDAGKKRDEVGSRMSPERLSQARAAVASWRPKAADPVANEAAQAPVATSLPSMARPQTPPPRPPANRT